MSDIPFTYSERRVYKNPNHNVKYVFKDDCKNFDKLCDEEVIDFEEGFKGTIEALKELKKQALTELSEAYEKIITLEDENQKLRNAKELSDVAIKSEKLSSGSKFYIWMSVYSLIIGMLIGGLAVFTNL